MGNNLQGLEALEAYAQDSTKAAGETAEAPAPETTTAPEEPEQKKPTKRKKSDGKRVNFVLPWDTYAQCEDVSEALGGNLEDIFYQNVNYDVIFGKNRKC